MWSVGSNSERIDGRHASIDAHSDRSELLLVDCDVFSAKSAAVGVRRHRIERVFGGGLSLSVL